MARHDRYELIDGSGLMAPAHSPQLWAGVFVGVPQHHQSLLTKLNPFARRFLLRYPQYRIFLEDRELTSAMLVHRLNALHAIEDFADRENAELVQEILAYRSDADPDQDLRVRWLVKDPSFDRPYWGGWKQAALQDYPDMTRRSSFVVSLENPGLKQLDGNCQATIEPREGKNAADALNRRDASELNLDGVPAARINPEADYIAKLDCERILQMLQKSVQDHAKAHGGRKNVGRDALIVFEIWQALRAFYPDINEIRELIPDNPRNKWKTILRLIEKPLADLRQQLAHGGYSPRRPQSTSDAGDQL